jgi:hypothetical protein
MERSLNIAFDLKKGTNDFKVELSKSSQSIFQQTFAMSPSLNIDFDHLAESYSIALKHGEHFWKTYAQNVCKVDISSVSISHKSIAALKKVPASNQKSEESDMPCLQVKCLAQKSYSSESR